MPRWTLKSLLAVSALAVVVPGTAAAQATIRNPGDHPNDSVELEPHAIAALLWGFAGTGFGLGGRVTITILQNGFVPQINNSVGIGFGLDWLHYANCWRGWNRNYYAGYPYAYECPSFNQVYFPAVLQWNFNFTKQFSAFVEPGTAIRYSSWPDYYCGYYDRNGVFYNTGCRDNVDWDPFILMVGGRFRFSQNVAVTGRIGYPYFSIGFSFFL
jgi:hypothetical protein